MNRDRHVMSDALFRKIVDECAQFKLAAIEPFLNGEPFMDPQIVPRLQYIRQKLPDTKLRLYTNGYAFTDKRVDELLDLGIDHLFISLNTLDPDRYENVMGLRLERTLRNLEYALDHSRRRRLARDITVRMTRTDQTTPADEKRFAAFCRDKNVHCMIVGLFNYLGDVRSPLPVPNFPCEHLNRVDVLSSGIVTLCCMDAEGDFTWGNANETSVIDIYNSKRALAYREAHRQGKRCTIKPCDTCNLFWPSFEGLSLPRRIQFGLAYGWYHVRYRPYTKHRARATE